MLPTSCGAGEQGGRVKLASIESISAITPHPNADSLSIAKILGWQTIVKNGSFTAGDRCVFVPIDTILPDAPWSAFLKKGDGPIRLKTIKLRGEYSQGLALPIDVLPPHMRDWQIGADVGGDLGIKKHEKQIPACLSGTAKGSFPQHLAPRTDEDNGLSHPEIVEATLRHSPLVATVKLDGSSCTLVVENGELTHVCSRNLSLARDEKNAFWKAALGGNYQKFTGVIQGELMGPGIQGNQLGLDKPTLFVFQIRFNDSWLPHPSIESTALDMGLRHVWEAMPCDGPYPLDVLQLLADLATLPNGSPAEGLVFRPQKPVTAGNGRPLGFKIINRNYKDT